MKALSHTKMKALSHTKEFEAKGYSFERFSYSDTERLGASGEVFKFYAAKNGRIVEKFEGLADAKLWIEFR